MSNLNLRRKILFIVTLILVIHASLSLSCALRPPPGREVTMTVREITALKTIENLTIALNLHEMMDIHFIGTVAQEQHISAHSSFLVNQNISEALWNVAIIGNVNEVNQELLNVSGILNLSDMTAEFRRTYYDSLTLYINPEGEPCFSFELTDVKGFMNVKIYFSSSLTLKYQATFMLGSTFSVVQGEFGGNALEVNSTEISALTSVTPFLIEVTKDEGITTRQLLLVKGTYIFSLGNISVPIPTQHFDSSIINEVRYTFHQNQFGYKIGLPNEELIHKRVEGAQIIGAEKSITVIVSTGKVEIIGSEPEGQKPEVTNVVDRLKREVSGAVRFLQENTLIPVLGTGAMLGAAWLVRRKRRTGKWLRRGETPRGIGK